MACQACDKFDEHHGRWSFVIIETPPERVTRHSKLGVTTVLSDLSTYSSMVIVHADTRPKLTYVVCLAVQ